MPPQDLTGPVPPWRRNIQLTVAVAHSHTLCARPGAQDEGQQQGQGTLKHREMSYSLMKRRFRGRQAMTGMIAPQSHGGLKLCHPLEAAQVSVVQDGPRARGMLSMYQTSSMRVEQRCWQVCTSCLLRKFPEAPHSAYDYVPLVNHMTTPSCKGV